MNLSARYAPSGLVYYYNKGKQIGFSYVYYKGFYKSPGLLNYLKQHETKI